MIYYGAIPDPLDRRDRVFRARGESQLPYSVDSRDEQTPVRFQKESDCVGQAITAWAEWKYWKILRYMPELSPTAAYKRGQEKDIWPGSSYDGTSLRGALKAWKEWGLCPLADWPYMGVAEPTAGKASKKYPLAEYRRIHGAYDIMQAIHEHGAVLGAFQAHEGWEHPVNGVIVEDGEPTEGHAVLICGFHTIRGFRLKNSWGDRWGDGGYAYLPKEMAMRDGQDFWLPIVKNGDWFTQLVKRIRG